MRSDSVHFRSPQTRERSLHFWVKWLWVRCAAVVVVILHQFYMSAHKHDREQMMCCHKIVCKSCVSLWFASKVEPAKHTFWWRWQKQKPTTKNSQFNDRQAAERQGERVRELNSPTHSISNRVEVVCCSQSVEILLDSCSHSFPVFLPCFSLLVCPSLCRYNSCTFLPHFPVRVNDGDLFVCAAKRKMTNIYFFTIDEWQLWRKIK